MPSQTNQFGSVVSPGHEKLLFCRMKGHEEMGRLFEYEVDLLSKEKHIDINKVLGEPMTIALDLPKGDTRYFNGIVTQFRQYGAFEDYFLYRAVLRPKLWLLTRTSKCRIFLEKSVIDIIKLILGEYGISVSLSSGSGPKTVREYNVQYRESDFDFVSRLMEQEGLYYSFSHTQASHELMITDSMNSHKTIQHYETIPYEPAGAEYEEAIQEWHCHYEITPLEYELTDFDFEKPRQTVKGSARDHKLKGQGQCHDYSGDYNDKNVEKKDLENYSRIRLEELQTDYEVIHGRSTAMAMSAGMLFTLKEHYDPQVNLKCVVFSVDFFIDSNAYRSGTIPFANNADPNGVSSKDNVLGAIFDCRFTAIPSVQQFRPGRWTPRPVIEGTQTAIVTEECDKYGRVKIKFHWSGDDASSWVRVSQPMAGKKWGWIALPKVGQEVIVSFIEGNPNRPIITGRVYNGEQMPPYDLPDNRTQSGIKTEKTNELRFEDKDGNEEIYLHAQKDLKCVIVNNETREVNKDRKSTVTGDDSLTVSKKCTIESMTSIELKVGSNSIKIDQQGITIKGVMVSVQGDTKLDVKSPMTTVNGDGMLTLKGGITMIN
ncbi:MAG: type VI secretion system tip protein VgrG [Methylococcaceae bacterium]|nr:type VI secretion system tip protein VgrG [Methylococcaceae bacterium]